MSPRPPADALVAVRSLPRRFRALFAGLGDDESPDALAARPGADGTTALGHLAAAAAALRIGADGLTRILTADDPSVDAIGTAPAGPGGHLDAQMVALDQRSEALAHGAEHVSADGWAR